MLRHDDTHRAGLVNSMETIMNNQVKRALIKGFGKIWYGRAVDRAVSAHGYGGQYLRDRPETFAEGRDALSLVRNWDTGDYALAALCDGFMLQGSASRVIVTFPCVPGSDYFYSRR